MKRFLILTAFAGAMLLAYVASQSSRQAQVVPVQRRIANFDSTPKESVSSGSADVVLVILQPTFAEEFVLNRYPNIQILKEFTSKMAADFQEVVTARGYTYRGPYKKWDNVVYSDKRQGDMYLLAVIDLDFDKSLVNSSPVGYNTKRGFINTGYRFSGQVVMKGKVNLYLTETTRNERLWVKSIELDNKSIPIDYTEAQNTFNFLNAFALETLVVGPTLPKPIYPGIGDPVLAQVRMMEGAGAYGNAAPGSQFSNSQILAYNGLVIGLEEYYKHILETAYVHLEPEELKDLKRQVKEIRKRFEDQVK
jgi:hypothetical protein